MKIDWEAPRVKRTFALSVLVPGFFGLLSYDSGMPWEWALLLAVPFGLAGGLAFGRRWRSRLCYCVPSTLTAVTVVGTQWIVIHGRPSVMFIEVALSELLGLLFIIPLWGAFYRYLDEQDDPQSARLAAFRAAMRRDDPE